MPRQRIFARGGLALVAIVAISFAVQAGSAARTTTVVLVRHAEKAAEPRENPPLSDAGRARAEALARAVSTSGVTAIITSQFVRTKQTAEPLATRLGLTPVTVPAEVNPTTHDPTPASTDRLAKEIASRGGTVLVVGHSNTVPATIAALGGPTLTIDDKTFDDMFVVTLVDGKFAGFAHFKYGP